MLILSYHTYGYYEPSICLECADGKTLEDYEKFYFRGNDEGYSYQREYGNSHYFKIADRYQLIEALKYLLMADTIMLERYEIQTEDLIKLLQDNNLGNTFFKRFVYNIQWLQNRADLRDEISPYDGQYIYGNQLFILDGKTPVYLVKDNIELQKMILSYCLKKNIEFKNEWFDIQEKDIQEWRHETEVKKLKKTLTTRQNELTATRKKIIRLEKEIIDLKEKIEQTENKQ